MDLKYLVLQQCLHFYLFIFNQIMLYNLCKWYLVEKFQEIYIFKQMYLIDMIHLNMINGWQLLVFQDYYYGY